MSVTETQAEMEISIATLGILERQYPAVIKDKDMTRGMKIGYLLAATVVDIRLPKEFSNRTTRDQIELLEVLMNNNGVFN
jgi:hypothetical protein